METLYEYLLDNYKENEPIFLVDIQIDGMTRTNVRQQIKKLADTGKVKRFDNGIYFFYCFLGNTIVFPIYYI